MNAGPYRQFALFRGMDDGEVAAALDALGAREAFFEKGETVLHAGETGARMGLVLDGSVTVESNDAWGNRTILSHVGRGGYFAETYALLEDEPMFVDVVANEDCRVLFLRIGSLKTPVRDVPPWRVRLTGNLLAVTARKNLHLSERSFHTAPKSIRGRVMAYLNAAALKERRTAFDIPFDRQQLADYLNVERTALAKELGRMRADGLIRFRRNHFEIVWKYAAGNGILPPEERKTTAPGPLPRKSTDSGPAPGKETGR